MTNIILSGIHAAVREANNMGSKTTIKWLATSEDQDCPAAESYLSLIYDSKTAAKLSRKLKKAPVSEFQAKDNSCLQSIVEATA